ncbi:hypothetical protein SAMN05443639_13311 [Stigmatella erecta]|uniref:Uncharacterized protein n=1 Tax=Stigmatella erecta TaxID=83460 RepID=A0A1I0LGB8_9BACT|nr:hypothetical protein SAMN05443639_13311 [Stigmatella erecta]
MDLKAKQSLYQVPPQVPQRVMKGSPSRFIAKAWKGC